MAIINTGLLTKGLRGEFFNRFENTKTHFQDLSTRVASTTDRETYRWLGTVPQVREWGTGRLAQGLRTESYSIENLKYESTLEVDRDEISDDQTGQIRLRVSELAQRAATHKDYLISQLLIGGETAGNNSYDGVSFFNATHASGSSGNQSNLLTFDATSTDAPTVEEFKAALKQAISKMLTYLDDQGQPMMITAGGLVCIVPPTMLFTATEAINATVIGNTTNVIEGIAKVVSLPWLTDASKWYVAKTDGVVRPFIFQDREPVEFNALTEDSDEGFRREKFLYGVRARYRMAYGYWQFAVRTDFV
ncbi:MAG TPA: Mu-like prophage major head subunit gpT family protein [Phycisphaerae bacterium]|nr:Mu-like prophage major head subunit gpT family protein [Phycisphaerae bacterium]